MRYAALISYDGTDFAGWQRQKNATSVQELVERALEKAFGIVATVTASGRTDSGVHAAGQICHFDADLTIPAERIPEAVNKFLPDGVALLKTAIAPQGFHANRSAKRKTYRYAFYVYPRKLPLKERYALRLENAPAKEALSAAASLFCGEHDFKAFCSADSSVKTTVRTVYEARIEERISDYCGECVREIDFFVTGNGFLYNMVRIMAGELIALASGRRTRESLLEAYESGERTLLDKTLPAKGLTLAKVCYDPDPFESRETDATGD